MENTEATVEETALEPKPPAKPKRKRTTPKIDTFDFSDPDIFLVENKDPERYYRWVRKDKDSTLNIAKFKRRGFIVESDTSGVETPKGIADAGDSSIPGPPGHILMSCPKDLNDAYRTRKQQNFEELRRREQRDLEKQSRMLKRMGLKAGIKFEEKDGYEE